MEQKLVDKKAQPKKKEESNISIMKIVFIVMLILSAGCLAFRYFIPKFTKPKFEIKKNEMKPKPFKDLLLECLTEYRNSKSLFGVPVVKNENLLPIGPAPGPHTQLTGNLMAAYAAGATVFELKTVQILVGAQLGIQKPCIYVGSEVYNIEWSTELTVEEAMNEYIKAAILIQVLSKEFGLTPFEKVQFVMSVGYDLKGIQSKTIDSFIEGIKWAVDTKEWKDDMEVLKANINQFKNFKIEDIEGFKGDVSNTVTLSTMHGCPAADIEKIGNYLLTEKKVNTYIKLNPTLLGKATLDEILSGKGYDIEIPDAVFVSDINLEQAKTIIRNCLVTAKKEGLKFGVKLTNTLPTKINNKELAGDQMYMSGPGLYAISINVANVLAEEFGEDLLISYSGGIDDKNIKDVLETGINPITVSSYLLKPKGYKNLSKLLVKAILPKKLNLTKLKALAKAAILDKDHNRKDVKVFKCQENYENTCAKCHNCEDVCPNRANRRTVVDGKEVVLHDPTLCNECGACAFNCIMGHKPYLEKANKTPETKFGIVEGICALLIIISLIGLIASCFNKKTDEVKEQEGDELKEMNK